MSNAADNSMDPLATRTGVFVMPGIAIRIPAGGIQFSIDENGEAKADLKALHLALGMAPHWLDIAMTHLEDARRQHDLLLEGRGKGHDAELRAPMEGEFQASMQACMAVAIALDAMYAMLKEHVTLEPALVATWREKGTARYKQVAEVIRRATHMGPKSTSKMCKALKDIYRFRDLAVHPHADFAPPVRHPDFGFGVEARIFAFRYKHASILVRAGLGIVHSASGRPHPKAQQGLVDVYKDIHTRTTPIAARWETACGPLFDNSSSP